MSHRLLFVLGKGGVGRTSVATALALRAGRAGKRALVVELNGIWDVGRRFGKQKSYEPLRIAEGVSWRSLTVGGCMEDFGRRKLKLGAMGARLMSSRPLRTFVEAVPGLPDLLQLGKIENLLNEPDPGDPVYDLVVVDAPATGHGLSLLAAPHSMSELTGSGPFHDLAANIAACLAHPDTGIVLATLAEELPFTETSELLDTLERSPMRVASVVVNRVVTAPLPDRSMWPAVRDAQPETPDHARLVALVESVDAVAREQEAVLQRIYARTEAGAVRVHTAPLVAHQGGRIAAASLADHLELP
ncbi:MAG: hypothetical protein H6736_20040 [Alphaproteobacteria bacterium]|nr:hypothetical protein [Alphaproteobacteria bacterium]